MTKKKQEQSDVTTEAKPPEMVADPLVDGAEGEATEGEATKPRSHEGTEGKATEGEATKPRSHEATEGEESGPLPSGDLLAAPEPSLVDVVDPARACLEKWDQKRVRALPNPAKMTAEEREAELAALAQEQADRKSLEKMYAEEIKGAREAIKEAERLIGRAEHDRRKLGESWRWLAERVRVLRSV